MTDRGGHILFVIGGSYLVYIGGRLVNEIQQSHPTNESMFNAFGIFFIMFGLIVAGLNLINILRSLIGKKESDTIVEEIIFPEEITAPFPRKEKTITMVKVGDDKADESEDTTDDEEDISVEKVTEDDDKLFEEKLERI